jgi:hypothetical protein
VIFVSSPTIMRCLLVVGNLLFLETWLSEVIRNEGC